MDTKQPEALRIADDLHHSIAHYGAEDAFTFSAYEAEQCVRALHAENERLRTCNKDAQHEIANLQARVQELGKAARDVNSRRVQELESQLEAIGAGGVEPLRKRCLHQISEPAQPAAQAAPEDASARFKAQHEFLIWNREQTPPPIESATEYSVFNQAVDFYIAARAAQEWK